MDRVLIRLADVFTRVIIFTGLRIAYLPSYFHSQNPTYTGVPAAVYALAVLHSSLITATTPLLKSFMLKFTVTVITKPTIIIARKRYGTDTNAKSTKTEVKSKAMSDDDGQSELAQSSDRIQGSNVVTS